MVPDRAAGQVSQRVYFSQSCGRKTCKRGKVCCTNEVEEISVYQIYNSRAKRENNLNLASSYGKVF